MVLMNSLYFDDEIRARMILEAEGKALLAICKSVWNQYEASYKPTAYIRTQNSMKSMKLGKVKSIGINELGIELTFVNDLVYHNSAFGSGHKKGHSIMLISGGWKVKSGRHKDVYRFGYYEGYDFVGKVKKEFESRKDRRVSLEIQWSGKALK